jgi:hypothetical protein
LGSVDNDVGVRRQGDRHDPVRTPSHLHCGLNREAKKAASERYAVQEFANLKENVKEVKSELAADIESVKIDLSKNSEAQRTYFIWIVGMLLAATGALALLYLTTLQHHL